MNSSISVIIPAYNEAGAIASTIAAARRILADGGVPHEIWVVDDGSSDGTGRIAESCGAAVIAHPENLGYGAALKTGILRSQNEWIAILDADGSYPVEELPRLLREIPAFDMVVGARTGAYYEGSMGKHVSRKIFQWLVEFVTGRRIPDINSGMRIFRRDIAARHFRMISNGFSFTTTLTLAMMLEYHFVKYVPIAYHQRIGKSHVHHLWDTLRAGQIIAQAILHYNPIKFFLLLMLASCASSLAGMGLAVFAGPQAALLIGWGGMQAALLLFGMGGLAYVVRSSSPD